MLTKNQLKVLRAEITLNSLFIKDYENTLRIKEKTVCAFFDSYIDNLSDLASCDGYEGDIIDIIDKYDNIDNLYNYYIDSCVDGYDPLLQNDYIASISITAFHGVLCYYISDYLIIVASYYTNKYGHMVINKITNNNIYYDSDGAAYFFKDRYKYYLSELVRRNY